MQTKTCDIELIPLEINFSLKAQSMKANAYSISIQPQKSYKKNAKTSQNQEIKMQFRKGNTRLGNGKELVSPMILKQVRGSFQKKR